MTGKKKNHERTVTKDKEDMIGFIKLGCFNYCTCSMKAVPLNMLLSWNFVEAESRILKTIIRWELVTSFQTCEVFENMGVFVGGQMFAKFIRKVSDIFTNITGAQVNLQTTQVCSLLGMGFLTPNNLPILK